MTIKITTEELIEIVKEKFIGNVEINEVIVEVELKDGYKDNIFFKKDNWFVGSFIEKQIKGEI